MASSAPTRAPEAITPDERFPVGEPRATGFPRRDGVVLGVSIAAAIALAAAGAISAVPLAVACAVGFAGLVTTARSDAWPVRRHHREFPDAIPDYTPEEPEPTETAKTVALEWEFKRDGLVPVTGEVELRIRQRDWEDAVGRNPYAHGESIPFDDVHLERLLDLFVVQGTSREVKKVASHLLAMARHRRFSVYEELCNALAAVHCVRYRRDGEVFGRGEYWRFPIETLYPLEGDCEDSAILLLAILRTLFLGHPDPRMNRDLVFLIVGDDPKILHAAVAVEGSEDFPTEAYFAADGKTFFYCEATGSDWRVGDVPTDVGSIRARIRLRAEPGTTRNPP
jgi:hypothetical protein